MMTYSIPYSLLLVGITALVTYLLRAVPFWIFRGKNTMPAAVKKVVDLLPSAIIAVLVIYCIKADIVALSSSSIAAFAAVISVVLIHLWKRNTLLSIAFGTILYMVLIRIIP